MSDTEAGQSQARRVLGVSMHAGSTDTVGVRPAASPVPPAGVCLVCTRHRSCGKELKAMRRSPAPPPVTGLAGCTRRHWPSLQVPAVAVSLLNEIGTRLGRGRRLAQHRALSTWADGPGPL